MSPDEAVAQLDALTGDDPEADHWEAEKIILSLLADEVREAFLRAQKRGRGWWYA